MQARTRIGLIVGAIGLVLNICVAGFIGVCGPGVSLIAGATAGGIAGGLIILGQILGGVGALALMQTTGTELPFGQVPSPSSDPGMQVAFYGAGIGTALCFGIVGALLAAGAGAGAGYFATPDPSITPSSRDIIS